MRIGDGVEPVDKNSNIKLPERFSSESKRALVRFVYQNFANLEDKCILTGINDSSHVFNDDILDEMDGPLREFASADSFVSESGHESVDQFTDEYMHSLTPSGYPRHILRLKKGAIVMLLRNLDVERGLTNGTRMIVLDMSRSHILVCVIVTGLFKGQKVLIPKIPIINKDTNLGLPCSLRRVQFPLRLAFAMTINKSQGQTFERVGVYLEPPVFTHGQLYVALSRVRNPANLRVFPGGSIMNVVFKSILL